MVLMGSTMSEKATEIQSFYKNRTIFLTGASGFLGKAIVEKLLRSCPEIGTIYVLIRPKYGVDVHSRLLKLLQSPIFDTIKSQNPSALRKIVAISGDITLPDLRMNELDRRVLADTVSVVIHSAASVRFNEPIKVAMNINYYSTERVLNLCRQMKKLVAFVHVSTAYSNSDLQSVPERIIPPPLIPTKELDKLSDEAASLATPLLIGLKPNSYTYTKCLAENMLQKQRNLPIAIVRPSIIGASWQEPTPGYIDSRCGITGPIAATGKGMLISMCADGSKVADLIPLDITSNLIVAVAYDTAHNKTTGVPVYNCCSGSVNPVTYGLVVRYFLEEYEETPYENVMGYPMLILTKYPWLFVLLNYFVTFIKCFAMDAVSLLQGKKGRMVYNFNKLISSMLDYQFFSTNEWNFEWNNIPQLRKRLSAADNRIFFTNVEDINWNFYIRDYVRGVKKWIFKEDNANFEEARARMNKFYWIQKSLLALVCFSQLYVAVKVHSYLTLTSP